MPARRSFTSGVCMIFPSSPFSRVMIGRGVPAGAITPYQVVTSKSLSPASTTVGTSGSAGEGAGGAAGGGGGAGRGPGGGGPRLPPFVGRQGGGNADEHQLNFPCEHP